MYIINEEERTQPYTMLMPAILDSAYPLLRYAFFSKTYYPVVLQEEEGITAVGLKYTNNDMCFPAVQIVGQIITALRSGRYDLEKTVILESQTGDACRGSNYVAGIRRALELAGFGQVPVLSFNLHGLENGHRLPLSIGMAVRAAAGVLYTDLLMILRNQIRPYEKAAGETDARYNAWISRLAEELKAGRNLSVSKIKERFYEIAADFRTVPRCERELTKVGIVGELYVKYCRLGNRNLEAYLREKDCEYAINGFSWYALYYADSHMRGAVTERLIRLLSSLQKSMVDAIRGQGFSCLDAFPDFRENARRYVSCRCAIGDGWLIGAEIAGHSQNGYRKILCAQPFGCMPNQVCGKGIYSALQRELEDTQLVSIDYDAGSADVNIYNRICLLLDL